ncbi:MAG: tetratricopeptide repeat protein [Phycisphaerales bacterium]
MNAERRHNLKSDLCCAFALSLAAFVSGAKGASPREMLKQGNGLYGDGQYTEAINKYNDALVEQPQAVEPRFNKANSYYRLDDLSEAMDLYQEVAARSKDMNLVAKAKYNLGNAFFQRGAKQPDSDLQKAVEDMKTSITHWRQVLDIDPKNEKAARNIEVARLTIKDILDQIKQQQKDQQNQQDPNQPQQGQQQQQQQQNQSQPQQDPNQPQDPNQAKDANQSQDPNQTKKDSTAQEPNQPQDQQQQVQDKREEQKMQPDATAQQIIDNEQRQKKEREIRQRATYQRVEKDW